MGYAKKMTHEDFLEKFRDTRDGIKNKFCLDNEIPLLRIPYWDFDSIEHIVFDELVELDILEEVLI